MDVHYLPIREDHTEDLQAGVVRLAARHHFEPRQLRAINAALATARPLLVRGEPGIGKSQLARAAAKALGRAFVQHVVDARTETRDLLWHFDAVRRLAEAQIAGALQMACPLPPAPVSLHAEEPAQATLEVIRERLATARFVHPRALWWAFDWDGAGSQARIVGDEPPPQSDGGDPRKGCVVLIDEIDKAESDVPNGLLEALGSGRFTPQGFPEPVVAWGLPPLVVITTNEERALPDAFIRRCVVLHLALPKDRDALIETLSSRGRTHFTEGVHGVRTTDEVLAKAAKLLARDRAEAERRHWRPLPGQAEYLDLLRAVIEQAPGDFARQNELLAAVQEFVLKKHPEADRSAERGEP